MVQEDKKLRESTEQFKLSLKDARVDLLSVGGKSFEIEKAQTLFLQQDLNVDKIDFFKVIMDDLLVNMDIKTLEAGAKGGNKKKPFETAPEKSQALDDQPLDYQLDV